MFLRNAIFISAISFLLQVPLTNAVKSCIAGQVRRGLICKTCPPGKYSDSLNAIKCIKCPKATFRSKPGARSKEQCLECPTGTFSDQFGSRECKPCPPGTDSPPGSQVCGACEPGSEISKYSKTGCEKCFWANFSDKKNSKACTRCLDGTVTSGTSIPFHGATSCDFCPPGTFRRISEFSFLPSKWSFEANKCSKCQPGTFQNKSGSKSCKLCPLGTFSGEGATSCTPCPSGSYSNTIPATKCVPCPDGTSAILRGSAGCKGSTGGCPVNTFENNGGVCQACLPGERYDMDSKHCVACKGTQISSGGVDMECKRCPKHKIPVGDLTFIEKSECECKPGYVDSGDGCWQCPPGTFWKNENFYKLEDEFFKRQGVSRGQQAIQGVCEICDRGTFNNAYGQFSCKACAVGTYQPYLGALSCIPCPPGSTSPRAFVRRFRADEDRGSCVVLDTFCPPGQIRGHKGLCVAKTCPLFNSVISSSVRYAGKRCSQCSQAERVRNGTCTACKREATRRQYPQRKCLSCPPRRSASFIHSFLGICLCKAKFVELNGSCVRRCPAGMGPRHAATKNGAYTVLRCVKCPSRQVSNRQTNFMCQECTKHTIALNGKKCKRCLPGQVVARDVYGRLVDRCR